MAVIYIIDLHNLFLGMKNIRESVALLELPATVDIPYSPLWVGKVSQSRICSRIVFNCAGRLGS